MNDISAEQLRELKMMFDYFDTDHSGALDTEVPFESTLGIRKANWDDHGSRSNRRVEAWLACRSWSGWQREHRVRRIWVPFSKVIKWKKIENWWKQISRKKWSWLSIWLMWTRLRTSRWKSWKGYATNLTWTSRRNRSRKWSRRGRKQILGQGKRERQVKFSSSNLSKWWTMAEYIFIFLWWDLTKQTEKPSPCGSIYQENQATR